MVFQCIACICQYYIPFCCKYFIVQIYRISFIHQLIVIQVTSTFCLCIMLLRTSMSKFVCGRASWNFWVLLQPLEGLPDCFPKHLPSFTLLPALYGGSIFSISSSILVTLFTLANLLVEEWCLHCGFKLHFPGD